MKSAIADKDKTHYISFMRISYLTIFTLFIVAFAALPVRANDNEKVFNAETFMLQNGMQVVVIPNHTAPVVTHMLWYKVGAADEAWGKSGIAHFLEHLLFKGSDGVKAGDFSKNVKKMGGQDNAFTSQDYTAYFQNIAVENLETVMKMEAGRVRGSTMPEEEVDSERLVILEERRQRTENNPLNHFHEQMRNALYPNHPYSLPVIGWGHEMAQLSRADAKGFYDIWYAPNNAILVVSGDITAEKLKPLAEKIYGVLPASPVPERNRPQIPDFPGTEILTLEHPTIHNYQYMRAYRVPSQREDKKIALAFQVLEDLLSNGSTSRLYKAMVIEAPLATSVGFSYDSTAYDDTSAWLSATLKDESVTFDMIEDAFQTELEKIATDGIPEDELRRSKERMKDAAIYARDSLSGPAMIFGYTLATGGTIDDIEYWPRDIESVTADDIVNVVKTNLLANTHYVTGHAIPPQETAMDADEPNKDSGGPTDE